MSDAAVQQPSPTKRGRGRGRGGAGRGAASARARGKPATGRRGRAKVYETSRAQAAHERQRDLKNAYSTLAAAMKPALEELADRNLDRLKSDFNAHKEVDQYRDITSFLDRRRQDRLSEISTKLAYSIACQTHQHEAQQEYTAHSFKVRTASPPFPATHLLFGPLTHSLTSPPPARIAVPTRSRSTTTSSSAASTNSTSSLKRGSQSM